MLPAGPFRTFGCNIPSLIVPPWRFRSMHASQPRSAVVVVAIKSERLRAAKLPSSPAQSPRHTDSALVDGLMKTRSRTTTLAGSAIAVVKDGAVFFDRGYTDMPISRPKTR